MLYQLLRLELVDQKRQVHVTVSLDRAATDNISIHFMGPSLSVVETYLTKVAYFSF